MLVRDRPDFKHEIPEVVNAILETCRTSKIIKKEFVVPLPSREEIARILEDLEAVIFPGYIGRQEIESENLVYYIGELVNRVYDKLSEQITRAVRYECRWEVDGICHECIERGHRETIAFLKKIPGLRETLEMDVEAAYQGDPASRNTDEIIFSYPGIKAVTVYRIAHELYLQDIHLIPRIMTEIVHGLTGIDIHPGAKIGTRFFIDHGTGVVIGETTEIGNNVQIYQGVTLGARRFVVDEQGELVRSVKRHPTIRDNVTIYAGATILGGDTVIGESSVIGGNVWITQSIPSNTRAILPPIELDYRNNPSINKEKSKE